jgi:DNA-binding NarL/FixJ family response regulator
MQSSKKIVACRLSVVAAGGLAAVLKADELQRALILLDIGVPKLAGIQVARQIRKVAPESKILFLSEELDPDVARAALSVGGHGYLIKSNAHSELFAAVEVAMFGKRFVSRGLLDLDLRFDDATAKKLKRAASHSILSYLKKGICNARLLQNR